MHVCMQAADKIVTISQAVRQGNYLEKKKKKKPGLQLYYVYTSIPDNLQIDRLLKKLLDMHGGKNIAAAISSSSNCVRIRMYVRI